MEPTLRDVEELARGAGKIIRRRHQRPPGFGQQVLVEYKSAIDPVTEVDKRSEAYLLEEIQRRYRHQAVITEESGQIWEDSVEAPQGIWYLDPLDGTVNFTHGLPNFCVSIGYSRGADSKQVQLGVVYDPILG